MFYNKDIFKRCFNYRPKYWYKNIAKIPLYFRLMRYLIKHGLGDIRLVYFDYEAYTSKF